MAAPAGLRSWDLKIKQIKAEFANLFSAPPAHCSRLHLPVSRKEGVGDGGGTSNLVGNVAWFESGSISLDESIGGGTVETRAYGKKVNYFIFITRVFLQNYFNFKNFKKLVWN